MRKLMFVWCVLVGLSLVTLLAQSQKSSPPAACEYRYEMTKAIPHPGIGVAVSVCASFPLRQLFGHDYDRGHFERSLTEAGWQFDPPKYPDGRTALYSDPGPDDGGVCRAFKAAHAEPDHSHPDAKCARCSYPRKFHGFQVGR